MSLQDMKAESSLNTVCYNNDIEDSVMITEPLFRQLNLPVTSENENHQTDFEMEELYYDGLENLAGSNLAFKLRHEESLENSTNSNTSFSWVPSNSSSLVGNHEFPWSARISFSNSPGKFYCDGVLINKRYILTTGRCLEPQRNIDKIRLGDHNCLPSENCHQNDYVDVDIEKVILHPGYGVEDGLTKDNIALIRLNKDIKSTDNISPVCLPKLNEIAKAGDKVIEIGWSMANSTYNKKLKTEATISDQLKCFKTYEQNFGVKLTNFHLCSEGYPEDRCASSTGDSLVRLRQPGKQWLLEGINYFGPTGCSKDIPIVFTRVEPYLRWIHQTIKN
ncbi:CLIP domain-containing serine protease B4-like [Diabrotica undecimpunctata]|uniref:CLIP domain-containing serine protease B4-like n=1 Tax=Diabrotica undecimpunctata TaxID=50387 RepID=UPI003B637B75